MEEDIERKREKHELHGASLCVSINAMCAGLLENGSRAMLGDDSHKLSQNVFDIAESDRKTVPVVVRGEKPITFVCYFWLTPRMTNDARS